MLVQLSDKDIETLVSYADGDTRVMRSLQIDLATLRDLALNANVEQCPDPTCRWWVEAGELIHSDSDEPDGHCCNCRPAETRK